MRRFLAACLLLLLFGGGDKANVLYETAQLEEKQNKRPHATKLYRQIVEEYPGSPYADRLVSVLFLRRLATDTSLEALFGLDNRLLSAETTPFYGPLHR